MGLANEVLEMCDKLDEKKRYDKKSVNRIAKVFKFTPKQVEEFLKKSLKELRRLQAISKQQAKDMSVESGSLKGKFRKQWLIDNDRRIKQNWDAQEFYMTIIGLKLGAPF